MKDLIQCTITFYGLQQWLESGTTPLTIQCDEENAAMFIRLERDSNVSYLYSVPLDQNGLVSWRDGPAFCGVYDAQYSTLYLTANFDVDAVFGTHVCTGENDDTLNVYANYDMAAGQVCDALEVDLHWADGREEAMEYRLNAVEKAVLLRKMDAYCQEQTGQTLKEYSAQRLAEDMTPPGQPAM